jgi:multimeric flavodoxin WrbA
VINDDMTEIYKDDFDVVVIASPIYISNLTGPLICLASRFQAYYAAKRFLQDAVDIKDKIAVLILVGGGDGRPEPAKTLAEWMFKKMRAILKEENMVLSLRTDELPAKEDFNTIRRISDIAWRINHMSGV